MPVFKKKLSDLTWRERLARVAITGGIPLVLVDLFGLWRTSFSVVDVAVVVIGNVVFIFAYALIEHAFFRTARKV